MSPARSERNHARRSTGLVHAADTVAADVVISTERMNRIEELDALGFDVSYSAANDDARGIRNAELFYCVKR